MKRLIALMLLAGAAASGGAQTALPLPDDDGGRIVGGAPAREGSAPWQAEIYSTFVYSPEEFAKDRARQAGEPGKLYLDLKPPYELAHKCGGVLIGDGWILTAAHCLVQVTGDPLAVRRIRLGTQNLEQGGTTYRIERAVVHKDYEDAGHSNDIALIRIAPGDARSVPDPARVRPIRLLGSDATDRPLSDFDRLSVTGWGLTGARDDGVQGIARDGSMARGSPVLLQVELAVLPRAQCEAVPAYRGLVTDSVICAGSSIVGRDSCNGDSGGPLTRAQGRERVLVGLVSWGLGCALPGVPGIYTRVSAYRGWIEAAKRDSVPGRLSRL